MNIGFPNLTAIYCSLLAIWLFVLSIRVIGLRGNLTNVFAIVIAQGKGDVELLNRAIRAQGNLIEYAPIMLFILFFLEAAGIPELALRILGDGFLLGRLKHARDFYGLYEVQYAAACGRYSFESALAFDRCDFAVFLFKTF